MQDIRKPYTRSRSNNDLQSRVEQFEAARYNKNRYEEDEDPVQIPVKRARRDVRDMDMYPNRRKGEDNYIDNEPMAAGGRQDDRPVYRDSHPRYVKRGGTKLSTTLSIVGIVLLVIGVGLYTYVFDHATITIVPKYKDINDLARVFPFIKEGTVGTEGVPFISTSTTLSQSKTLNLSESRKVEAKATGKVTIYNNYDSNPQKLIKNTRFLSTEGKIYRINQSIEVPGKKGLTPGSLTVMLYADSNGSDYNSSATSFTIPGFKGSPRESAFNAKSVGPLTGGSSGSMSLVSLSDLNAAKDSLTLSLEKEIKDQMQKVTQEGYVPMTTALEVTYDDNADEVLKGTTGTYKLTATGHLMLADESKLAEAIGKTLVDYTNEPLRLDKGTALTFTRKQSDHMTSSSTVFSILVEGKPRIIWASDTVAIKSLVKGKSRDEFKPLMKTISSIESAEINFSPLWLSRFPSDITKITVIESLPKR